MQARAEPERDSAKPQAIGRSHQENTARVLLTCKEQSIICSHEDERSECKPDRAQQSRDERSECKPDRAQQSRDERSECKPDRAQQSRKEHAWKRMRSHDET